MFDRVSSSRSLSRWRVYVARSMDSEYRNASSSRSSFSRGSARRRDPRPGGTHGHPLRIRCGSRGSGLGRRSTAVRVDVPNRELRARRGPDGRRYRTGCHCALQELLVLALQVVVEGDALHLEPGVFVAEPRLFLAVRGVEVRGVVESARAADTHEELLHGLVSTIQRVPIERLAVLVRERQARRCRERPL